MDKKNTKEEKSVHELKDLRREYRKQNIYEKINKMKKENKNDSLKNLKVDINSSKENIINNGNKIESKEKNKNVTAQDKLGTKKAKRNTKAKTKSQNKSKEKKAKLRTKKQWKRRRVYKSILIIILTAFIVFFSYFVYMFLLNGGGLKGVVSATLGHNPKKVENLKPFNILILGTNEGNTDTIILASYNPKTQEASMLSIPRDTFIGTNVNTASAAEKINAVYFNQGIEALQKKVENLTGVDIPYYAVLTTENISNLMKLIGDVEFDVPIDMHYTDEGQKLAIRLKKGPQKITSEKAEMLLRFRHNDDGTTYPPEYGVEDHGRMRTQREFLKAAANKLIREFDISKMYELISNARAYVETNLKFQDYRDYIPYIVEFNSEDIKVGKVNGSGVLTRYFFFVPDYYDLDKTIFDLFIFSDDERKNSPGSFKVNRNINQVTTVAPVQKPKPEPEPKPKVSEETEEKTVDKTTEVDKEKPVENNKNKDSEKTTTNKTTETEKTKNNNSTVKKQAKTQDLKIKN